jgi:energy-coupling factor transporter ATP-binding protein EcfA2
MNDTPLVTLPCYEPAGVRLTLTEADLLQHVLAIGSTGSGKSTLLWSLVEQLMPHGTGLLLLDAKVDGLVPQFTDLARRWGRERDLVFLGPEGTHALD